SEINKTFFLKKERTVKELIKTDINNITEIEFRIVVIRLFSGLEKSIEDSRESIAAEIWKLRNSHNELRNAVNEVKNKLAAARARMEEAEGIISEIEDKIMENDEAKNKTDRKTLDHEGGITELSDSMKHNNIHIIGVPEEEERDKGAEGLVAQTIAENFPNLGKKADIHIQEAQRTPFRFNRNRSSP
ncbi:LORF1 protein, partial [Crocuta crocuta]